MVGGGWRGVHSEGTAWSTLFGLLFADILIATPRGVPRRGVFRSDFELAPLDLCADVFLPRRFGAIASRLDEIRRGGARVIITHNYGEHYGAALRGVSWTLLTLEDLQNVADGLGGSALAHICALKAEDYGWVAMRCLSFVYLRIRRVARSAIRLKKFCLRSTPTHSNRVALLRGAWSSGGAPDLLLWRLATAEKGAAAKAVEVKSRNDTLSDQQRAWLLALRDAGVTVAVCKVD